MAKKIGIGVLVVVLLLIGGTAGLMFSVFGGNKPVEDGASYGRTTVIEDVSYVSVYLLDVGNGKFVVIDGGVDTEATKIRALLKERGATIEDVEAIVLTHGHGDHIGAAYGLTDIPLYAHKDDVEVIEGRAELKGTVAKMGGKHDPGLKVDHPFNGGDILKFGDVELEVFHTPGHTAGNCAFLIDGVLLLGDTAQVTSDDTLVPPPTFFSDDPSAAIASIRKLADEMEKRPEKPNTIVGSHSGATKNVDALASFEAE